MALLLRHGIYRNSDDHRSQLATKLMPHGISERIILALLFEARDTQKAQQPIGLVTHWLESGAWLHYRDEVDQIEAARKTKENPKPVPTDAYGVPVGEERNRPLDDPRAKFRDSLGMTRSEQADEHMCARVTYLLLFSGKTPAQVLKYINSDVEWWRPDVTADYRSTDRRWFQEPVDEKWLRACVERDLRRYPGEYQYDPAKPWVLLNANRVTALSAERRAQLRLLTVDDVMTWTQRRIADQLPRYLAGKSKVIPGSLGDIARRTERGQNVERGAGLDPVMADDQAANKGMRASEAIAKAKAAWSEKDKATEKQIPVQFGSGERGLPRGDREVEW